MAKTFNIQPGDRINFQLADRTGRLVPGTLHALGVGIFVFGLLLPRRRE